MPGFSVITQIQLATYFHVFKAELWLQNLLSSRFKWYLVHWHPDYCHQSSGFTITNIIATLSSQSSPTSQASFTIIRLFWQKNTRMKLKSDIKNCEVFFASLKGTWEQQLGPGFLWEQTRSTLRSMYACLCEEMKTSLEHASSLPGLSYHQPPNKRGHMSAPGFPWLGHATSSV